MPNIPTSILIVLLIVVIYKLVVVGYTFSTINTFKVYSEIDREYYNVNQNHKDTKKAADLLAQLNKRAITLLRHLKTKYSPESNEPTSYKETIKFLLSNYNPDMIIENSPNNIAGSTSYTKNKGEVLAICLRKRKDGDKFEDINTLTFVIIHEIAHMATKIYGHTREFWENFAFLLKEAVSIGLYVPVNYRKHPVNYCGLLINSSPLYG